LRILFVSQLFDPENAIKGLAFAQQLQAKGHEVEVVTTFPSYPGGKVYSGYTQKWRKIEQLGGVRVVRVPTYISHGQSAFRRMMSYASFAFAAGCYCLFFARRANVIYAYYPPVMVGLMALLVGWFRRTPYVYDVQDLWPEALTATGNISSTGRVVRVIELLCGWVYRRAARVVVLSEGYRVALIHKGVAPEKIVKIYNWCDETRLQATNEAPACWRDLPGRFRVLYAGNLGSAQALRHVIDAAGELSSSGNADVQIILLGNGVQRDELMALVQERQLSNVSFLPQVSVDQVGNYLLAADALLVHLADDPVFDITIPQKTQAYLMAGRPIVMAVRGESGALVAAAGAGITVPPCDAKALARGILELSVLSSTELCEMGERGQAFYQQKMSMSNGVAEVERLLLSVVSSTC